MKKRIVKITLICICFAFTLLAAGTILWLDPATSVSKASGVGGGTETAGDAEVSGGTEVAAEKATTDLAPMVSAKGAILVDCSDGRVIYEKNADEKLYPASTTKIMTAIVVLQTLEETETTPYSYVSVPAEAVGVEGSSIYLKEGEKLTIRELMYGMMLQSGNDAAMALAICCGGNLENFIDKMNRKAEELGCANTNFVNPSGLFDENHYTTARDLALIGRKAMENEDFRRIAGAESWESEETGRIFANKNKTIRQYDGATGIKIGYTRLSGRTLVASAKRGETELVAVVLNDSNWFNDAYAMLDYGFSQAECNS